MGTNQIVRRHVFASLLLMACICLALTLTGIFWLLLYVPWLATGLAFAIAYAVCYFVVAKAPETEIDTKWLKAGSLPKDD